MKTTNVEKESCPKRKGQSKMANDHLRSYMKTKEKRIDEIKIFRKLEKGQS